QKNYGKYTIGFSDHTLGIATPLAAVAMGAKIIEKHITLDRKMKGTDQKGSLGPDGIFRMVRDIRVLDMSFGKEEIFIEPSVMASRIKLERSIASIKDLKAGHIITEADIHMLSPGDGFKWAEKNSVIGKKLLSDLPGNEIIYPKHIQP
ncbi:MAG: N-acetylneuraminate synthase family protein, partial [Bacteroidia bacterium]